MAIPTSRSLLSAFLGLVFSTSLFAQTTPKLEFPQASPPATIKQRVGLTDITIEYSRPSVRNRVIFGGLVPYGQVWRTGANTATKITFSAPVKLNGTAIAAGTYELFTIPGKDEWTIIIHKDTSEWGAYTYDAKNDIARFTAKPTVFATNFESMTFGFNDLRDTSATLYITWATTRVPITVEVDTVATLVPQIKAAMAAEGKKPYFPAAMFYYENNIDLKQAVEWMDAAIALQPKAYYMVYRKGLILAKMGDKAGAIAAAEASIALAKADKDSPVKEEYLRLNEGLIASLR